MSSLEPFLMAATVFTARAGQATVREDAALPTKHWFPLHIVHHGNEMVFDKGPYCHGGRLGRHLPNDLTMMKGADGPSPARSRWW
jgi:hypothetical protein